MAKRFHGDLEPLPCSVPDCDAPHGLEHVCIDWLDGWQVSCDWCDAETVRQDWLENAVRDWNAGELAKDGDHV